MAPLGRNTNQSLSDIIFAPWLFLYWLLQSVLDYILSPNPPKPDDQLKHPRVAVIGAGLTGVSAASHIVGHGYDCHIFEKGDESHLGGIWSQVNSTSGLQISSLMYRFQPSVKWSEGYPKREEIVGEIRKLWERYHLQKRTSFNTKVEKVYRDNEGYWIVNDPSYGRFEGILAAIGTCGDPKMPHIEGQEKFKGEIYHSSQLDGKDVKGKKVLIIGGGASAVEALEFVDQQEAAETKILARSEKWIIPRNAIIDGLLAFNIFGQETMFSWIPEGLLRIFFYRDLADIAPPSGSGKGVFTETPMVNSRIFDLIRQGKAKWLRGDVQEFQENGILFNHRAQGVGKGGPGHAKLEEGDVVIQATGFKRPSLSFLPDDCFEEPYQPPNWYLQVFPTNDPTVCANNCTYVNAIGSVGNYHIGIYTRFLLMFLLDPLARPSPWLMRTWVDFTRWVKRTAPTGAFDFFTYSELIYWFVFVIVINPFRWKWGIFVLFGITTGLPFAIVHHEDRFRAVNEDKHVDHHRRDKMRDTNGEMKAERQVNGI